MDGIITAINSPLAIKLISTGIGVAIGALAAFMRSKKKDADASGQMLRGLGHDRIICLGECYLKRGGITRGEYENLHDYLFVPYAALGGNGTAKRIMEAVDELAFISEGEKTKRDKESEELKK
jgi:hypothetical protein